MRRQSQIAFWAGPRNAALSSAGVEHDHMNVLVLGARVVGEALARELVTAYVNAECSQEERHLRRLAKVAEIEKRCSREPAKLMATGADL